LKDTGSADRMADASSGWPRTLTNENSNAVSEHFLSKKPHSLIYTTRSIDFQGKWNALFIVSPYLHQVLCYIINIRNEDTSVCVLLPWQQHSGF